jgi:glucokinase
MTAEPPQPAGGRDRPLLVGVDVGGSKIAVLVVDRDERVLARQVAPTSAGDQDRAVGEIAAVVDAALAQAGATPDDIAAIGVGVPGRVDPLTGAVTLAVNLGWSDLPLGSGLENRFGRPCVVENDVRAAAVGLHRRRVVGEVDDLAYLAVGTGVSAGVVLHGRLHRGARGLAGEIGHVIVEPGGPRCACGQDGCLETLVSGSAIARLARDAIESGRPTTLIGDRAPAQPNMVRRRTTSPNYLALGDDAAEDAAVDGVRATAAAVDGLRATAAAPQTATEDTPDHGTGPTAIDVYRAAGAGDPLALEIVDRVGRRLAWAVHLLVMAYDVERVVLGGGVSHAGETFGAPILRELDRMRAASALAREQLAPGIVELLPTGADAGAWGAVVIAGAAQARIAAGQGWEEVGHVRDT